MQKTNKELLALRQKHVPQAAFNITQLFVEKARGAMLTDIEGNEFIDFAGGIGCNNVGHSHPKVVQAIKDQAENFIHSCWHVSMYESYVRLAERLNDLSPGDTPKMTMFANSGAEAVENAVKASRYASGRPSIICFDNGFHGRTLLTMSMTSKIKPYKFKFGPFAPEIYRMPYAYCYRCPFHLDYPKCNIACADYLEEFFITNVAPELTAAVVAEPIQGEGGFVTPPPEYFQRLQQICQKYGIHLIIDEVQSGVGRTGKFFAIDHWQVEPDIITLGKSLAGGMPLSAVTGSEEIMNKPHVGGMGGTFAGNPVSCSAGLAVLDILIEDGMLERAETLGEKFQGRLKEMQKQYEIIGDVRGKGPMLGLELVRDRNSKEPAAEETKQVLQYCFEKGLILLSCGVFGNVIRTLMPFVATDEQLEKGLQILEEGIRTVRS